ncbi:helix-turn-helix transcriptional regulator [Haladaptatus sp. NG-SE-30]
MPNDLCYQIKYIIYDNHVYETSADESKCESQGTKTRDIAFVYRASRRTGQRIERQREAAAGGRSHAGSDRELLEQHGGTLRQQEIISETGWSRSRVSRFSVRWKPMKR